jgi:RNA polymerase sigma-70 factor (ECF subfamily)
MPNPSDEWETQQTAGAEKAHPGARIEAVKWLEHHGDALYRFALIRVRDRAVAEDLVQETLLAGWCGREAFSARSAERTWLMSILKHKLIDHIRSTQRETPSAHIDGQVDAWFNDRGRWACDPAVIPDPRSAVEFDQLRDQLLRCIGELPPRLAQAFILTQLDSLSSAEACKALKTNSTNLWVMLHRARLRLRQCLEKAGFARESR